MGNRRIILELDREPQDLQAVWRLDSIARLIQQALTKSAKSGCSPDFPPFYHFSPESLQRKFAMLFVIQTTKFISVRFLFGR